MGDAEVLGLDAAVLELGLGAQVEHRAHPEQRQLVELVVGQPVERVGPVEGAPPDRLAGPTAVAAEVPEVERALEAELGDRGDRGRRRREGRTPGGG